MNPCPICEHHLEFIGEHSGEYRYECPGCNLVIRPGKDFWVRCWGCSRWCKIRQQQCSPHRELFDKIKGLVDGEGYTHQEAANELNWLNVNPQKQSYGDRGEITKKWSRTKLTKFLSRSPVSRYGGAMNQQTYCSAECREINKETSFEEEL